MGSVRDSFSTPVMMLRYFRKLLNFLDLAGVSGGSFPEADDGWRTQELCILRQKPFLVKEKAHDPRPAVTGQRSTNTMAANNIAITNKVGVNFTLLVSPTVRKLAGC